MKRLFAIGVLALALTGKVAFAEKERATGQGQNAPSGWTGYNVGLDSGYAWDPIIRTAAFPATANIPNIQFFDAEGSPIVTIFPGLTPNVASALSATGLVRPNVGGFIGGGQVGYNYQYGDSIVAGIEADFQGAAVRGQQGFLGTATSTFFDAGACSGATGGCPVPVTSFVDNEKSVDWLGTVRARFGYLATPTLLVYATGGLAYGGVTASDSIFQTWGPRPGGPTYQSPGAVGHFSGTLAGWTVGGGLEWLFLPNWSAKVEYLHYDLGAVQFASGPLLTIFVGNVNALTPVTHTVSDIAIPITYTRFYGDTVRAGVNYHFNF